MSSAAMAPRGTKYQNIHVYSDVSRSTDITLEELTDKLKDHFIPFFIVFEEEDQIIESFTYDAREKMYTVQRHNMNLVPIGRSTRIQAWSVLYYIYKMFLTIEQFRAVNKRVYLLEAGKRRRSKKTAKKSPCRVPSKSRLQKMSTTKVQKLARSLETKARNLRKKGRVDAANACTSKRSQLLQNAF